MTQQKAGQKTETNPKKNLFLQFYFIRSWSKSSWTRFGPVQIKFNLIWTLYFEMIPEDGANIAVCNCQGCSPANYVRNIQVKLELKEHMNSQNTFNSS